MAAPDISRRPLAVALVAAPLLWLAAEAFSPALKTESAAQLAEIARHSNGWYGYTALLVLGTIVFVPAILGIMRLTRTATSKLTLVGGIVLGFGTLISLGDAMSQIVIWQMAVPGADRGQMAALLDRFDNASGAQLFFGPGGLAFVAGTVLLTIALFRSRAVPRWAAVAFLVGMVAQIIGFTSASVAVIAVGNLVLLIGMSVFAARLWQVEDETVAVGQPQERAFVPAI